MFYQWINVAMSNNYTVFVNVIFLEGNQTFKDYNFIENYAEYDFFFFLIFRFNSQFQFFHVFHVLVSQAEYIFFDKSYLFSSFGSHLICLIYNL